MNEQDVNGVGGVDAEKARRRRLGEFLRELVRAEGRMEAAGLLGVDYRTLVKAEESGEITGRMGDALELLLVRKADDAEVGRLREAVGALERRVAVLEGGTAAHRVADAEEDGVSDGEEGYDEAGAQGEDAKRAHESGQPQAENGGDGDGAGRSETRAAPLGEGSRQRRRVKLRRANPEVVTEQPADDDAEVYGAAWPLVEEWRRLRDGHPYQGRSLWWLTTQERLLTLELAMLEEHGLTLPPETQALRGFGRRGQTSWRWKALADTKLALRKRKLLRWVMPWLWREKVPEFPPGPVLGGR